MDTLSKSEKLFRVAELIGMVASVTDITDGWIRNGYS